jgi:signal transduction histidine kinase
MSDSGLSADIARKELYEVMRLDLPFEEKATRALSVGERFLGVDNGHVTRIDPESNYWQAVASTDSPDGSFPAGLVTDFDATYCRRTVESGGSLALSDAPEAGWGDDPAFEAHGLHCYHGTPLVVDSDLYGTVCFVSEAPRERPFSEVETTFAELLARMLERELERRQMTATIERYEEFASVLSHDLRNPLNVAQGRVDLERSERESENLAIVARSLDRIESIIASVLRVAREGRDIDATSVVSLSTLAERCWESIGAADATLLVDEEFTFRADAERVRGIFENLFRNAVEHGGDDVTIRVGPLDGGEGFYVEDDGPGIPESDRETVFDPGYTTGREGVGLGLSIVEGGVEAHGWRIEATDAETGGARFEIRDVIPA